MTDQPAASSSLNTSSFASQLPAGLIPTNRHVDLRALTYEVVARDSDNRSKDNDNKSGATDQLLKAVECSICQAVLVEPWSTRCGHTFCAACLRAALRVDPRCPVDRTPLRWGHRSDVRAAPLVIAGVVDELVVACPNAPAGCPYRCARGLVESHVWHDCRYTEVECPGCGTPIERRFFEVEPGLLASPGDECPHAVVVCTECGTDVQRYKLPEHICEPMPVVPESATTDESFIVDTIACPLCNEATTKCGLQAHLAETCSEATVGCAAGTPLGCRWKGKRQAYNTRHRKNCPFVVLGPTLRHQNERLNRLQEENRQLNFKLDHLKMILANAGLDDNDDDEEQELHRGENATTRDSTLAPASSSTPGVSTEANVAGGTASDPQANNINLTESDFMSLFMEGNRFRTELERVKRSMEMRMVQEGFRTSEELVGLRAMVNGLRQQVNFLWTERRLNNNNSSFFHQPIHHQQQNGHRPNETVSGLGSDTNHGVTSMPRRLSDISRQDVKL
jgi:hypothetical protein